MAAGSSANASIVHDTPHTDGMEGSAPPQLADNDDDIKDVDMPENESVEIINVNDDYATNGEKEDPTDHNPGYPPSQKQDGISNTADDTSAIYAEDATKDLAAGDNPKGSIKLKM